MRGWMGGGVLYEGLDGGGSCMRGWMGEGGPV